MFAPFSEGFVCVGCELQHIVSRLKPAIDTGIGVIQKFVELCFLLVQDRLLTREFLLADFTRGTHVDKRVDSLKARVVIFLLIGKDRVAVCGLAPILVLQPPHCPLVEFLRRLHFCESLGYLFLKLLHLDAFLTAFTFALCAVVVGVVMHVAVLIALGLILGRDHTTTFSAPDHAGVRERVRLGLGLAASAQQGLYAVEFLTRDHWLVFAFVPIA